eukprot:SAG11_NODE_15627_length_571_cov_1.203390_1_plen_68_part_00
MQWPACKLIEGARRGAALAGAAIGSKSHSLIEVRHGRAASCVPHWLATALAPPQTPPPNRSRCEYYK